MEKLTTKLEHIEEFYEEIDQIINESSYQQNILTPERLSAVVEALDELRASSIVNDTSIPKVIDLIQSTEIQSLAEFKEIELADIEREHILTPEFDVGSLILEKTQEKYGETLSTAYEHLILLKDKLGEIIFVS